MAELLKKDEMKPGTVAEGGTMADLYTGSWRTYCPITDFEKCIHCMLCWIVCPDSAVRVEGGKKLGTDYQYCKGCGICATECPVDAIEMKLESDLSEEEKEGEQP
jgi:pyruvate ferredoxin oxidoreductase delta subunit